MKQKAAAAAADSTSPATGAAGSIVRGLTGEFIASNRLKGAKDINGGLCPEFAEELVFRLRSAGMPAEQGHRDWLEPELRGLSDDEAEELESSDAYLLPHHVWVESGGLLFDAEAPDGVPSWEKLPIFARFLAQHPEVRSQLEGEP